MSASWTFRSAAVALVALACAVGGSTSAAGSGLDATPPVLRGLSVSGGSATPGTPVTVTLDAVDDVAVVRSEVLWHEVTSGVDQLVSSDADPSVVTTTVGSDWANGTMRVYQVHLFDSAGNEARYLFGGYVLRKPGGQTTHDVDLARQSITVSGAADRSPPVLTAVSMVSAAAYAGDPNTYSWAAHDLESSVATVRTTWAAVDSGDGFDGGTMSVTGTSGTGAVALPVPGRWRLQTLEVTDGHGNRAEYSAYGWVRFSGGEIYGSSHDLDFDAVGVTQKPAAPPVQLVERPRRLSVLLGSGWQEGRLLKGYRLSVQPAGIVRTVAVGPSTFFGRFRVDLDGLPNGLEQTVTVTALSTWGESRPTVVRARPSLARTVHGSAGLGVRPDVIAGREYGTTEESGILSYPGRVGGLGAPQLYSKGFGDGCLELVPFTLSPHQSMPLCRKDDMVPLLYATAPPPVLGSRGWSVMRFVDGGYDLNGDGTGDVVAVDPAGVLRLYAQTRSGRLVAWPRIGTGWQGMISVVSAGDLTGDRRNDIVAADAAGRLWLYPGNGKGGVTARRQIGSGWHQMAALFSLRDLSGDGTVDLGGITPGGELRMYRGTGTGAVRPGVVIGTGWQRFL